MNEYEVGAMDDLPQVHRTVEERSQGKKFRVAKRGRRTKYDIYADILKAAVKGALRTHISGKAYVNYALLPPYLRFLTERGLLSKTKIPSKNRYKYRTTPRGIEYLDHYQSLVKALEDPLESTSWY